MIAWAIYTICHMAGTCWDYFYTLLLVQTIDDSPQQNVDWYCWEICQASPSPVLPQLSKSQIGWREKFKKPSPWHLFVPLAFSSKLLGVPDFLQIPSKFIPWSERHRRQRSVDVAFWRRRAYYLTSDESHDHPMGRIIIGGAVKVDGCGV